MKRQEGSNKKSVYIYSHDLQNNRVLTSEGCFGFHRAVNVKEADYIYDMRERNILGESHVHSYF